MPSSNADKGPAANGYIYIYATATEIRATGESSEVPIKHDRTSSDRFQSGSDTMSETLADPSRNRGSINYWQYENPTILAHMHESSPIRPEITF